MSYYEDRIKALEARIEEMAMLNRMKAIPVEANLMKRIGELNDKNARLKAEVERLTAIVGADAIDRQHGMCCDASAQVERVGAENAHLHKGIYSLSLNVAQLKDEVERLTKAGDAMAEEFSFIGSPDGGFNSIEHWNAAKEGKQP